MNATCLKSRAAQTGSVCQHPVRGAPVCTAQCRRRRLRAPLPETARWLGLGPGHPGQAQGQGLEQGQAQGQGLEQGQAQERPPWDCMAHKKLHSQLHVLPKTSCWMFHLQALPAACSFRAAESPSIVVSIMAWGVMSMQTQHAPPTCLEHASTDGQRGMHCSSAGMYLALQPVWGGLVSQSACAAECCGRR